MKYIFISTVLLFSILAFSSNSYGQDEFPGLESSYLGQKNNYNMTQIVEALAQKCQTSAISDLGVIDTKSNPNQL